MLIVEDNDSVRGLVSDVLNMKNYKVLKAADPAQALQIAAEYADHIHLILSDVIMPGMIGPKLVEELTSTRKDMRVIYMTGYTDTSVIHHGILSADVAVLNKPISPKDLATKVREVLDAPGYNS